MRKCVWLAALLIPAGISVCSVAGELKACGDHSLVVGIYEDHQVDRMLGSLYLHKPYTRDDSYAQFVSKMVANLTDNYGFESCHLKGGEHPVVEISFINHPFLLWRSKSSRNSVSEHGVRTYRNAFLRDFRDLSQDDLLAPPEVTLSESINYLCRIDTPWMKMGVYFDGNIKNVNAVINWSTRQHIYDQYLLSKNSVDQRGSFKPIFSDTYRFHFNDYRDAWFHSKDLEEYLDKVEHIPPDLVWLFASSPNVSAHDSTFPDIGMVVDHAQDVYSTLIGNLFDVCYRRIDYREIKIRSIIDSGDYVDLSGYKIERPILKNFRNEIN
ncbi:hypothetical protein [Microbulbifer aggregans]|uniref:hypothetical protein n=1 Tax=Microbulbifer aggregans TaxID=1769779 RepID=UPI001CFC7F24|nr:hypothetical protein [Microbulbifer aggregans]